MKFMPFVTVVILSPKNLEEFTERREGSPLFDHYQVGHTQEYLLPLSRLTEQDIHLLAQIAPGAMSSADIVLFDAGAEQDDVLHMLQHPGYHSGIMDRTHLILARTLEYEAHIVKQDIEKKEINSGPPLLPSSQSEPEPTYVGETEVELLGQATMRQRRTLNLTHPLAQSEVAYRAVDEAGDREWSNLGVEYGTIEVTIHSQPMAVPPPSEAT